MASNRRRHVNQGEYQIVQANIARAIAPLDDPVMAGFVEQLDYINSVADRSPGFVWRLQTAEGDATAIRAFDDERTIFNMSIWSSIESLYAYTYRSDHLGPLRDRRKWFERMDHAHLVLWWVPAGHVPTLDEAVERLNALDRNGPSSEAFTLRHAFTPDGEPFNPKYSADWAFDGTGA
jgi:hypothetical protein